MLILIVLLGVGLWALPQTVALFAGQHSFVNIDATGNQIECVKCHGDVQAELNSGHNNIPGTDGPHADFKCEYCHRIEAGSSSGDNAYGVVPYTVKVGATTFRRMYLVPVMDMEMGNFPEVINGSDVLVGDKTLAGVSLVGGKGKLSDVITTPNGEQLLVGAVYDLKLVSTYNPATGQPLDTNPATKNSGLDLSKVNITVTTSRPYYTAIFNGSGSRAVNPGTSYHAASLVGCMECHSGEEPMGHYSRIADGTDTSMGASAAAECSDCHYGSGQAALGEGSSGRYATIWAGGFGLTNMVGDTGDKEAHMAWITSNNGISVNGNDACVACHTHVAVDITYTKATTMSFNANTVDRTVDGFVVGGNTYTYSDGR